MKPIHFTAALCLAACVFTGCGSSDAGNVSLKVPPDSLQRESLRADTIAALPDTVPSSEPVKTEIEKVPDTSVRKQVATRPEPKKEQTDQKANADALPAGAAEVYRYTSGKVSVLVHAWEGSMQKIELFSPDGEVTYTLENSRAHLIAHHKFTFQPDGSVSTAVCNSHPDAGIQQYTTTYYFSEENVPRSRVDYSQDDVRPSTSGNRKKYYWDGDQWKPTYE